MHRNRRLPPERHHAALVARGVDAPVRVPSHTAAKPENARQLNSRIARASELAELRNIYSANRENLDEIHVTTLLSRLVHTSAGKAASPIRPQHAELGTLVSELLQDASRQLDKLTARQVSNILWAVAKLGTAPPCNMVHALVQRAHHQLGFSRFKPQELANVLYALGVLGSGHTGTSSRTYSSLGWSDTSAGDAALSAGAAAAAGSTDSSSGSNSDGSTDSGGSSGRQRQGSDLYICSTAALDAAAHEFARQLASSNPQDLSQAAVAFARLGYQPPPGWLAAWSARADQLLPVFQRQALANSAWALARLLKVQHEPGCLSLGDAGPRGSGEQLAPGDAAAGGSAPGATAPVVNEAGCAAATAWIGRALQFAALHAPMLTMQEVCNLLWAAGSSGADLPQVCCSALLQRALQLLPEASSRDAVSLLHALVLLQHAPRCTRGRLQCTQHPTAAQVRSAGQPAPSHQLQQNVRRLRQPPPQQQHQQQLTPQPTQHQQLEQPTPRQQQQLLPPGQDGEAVAAATQAALAAAASSIRRLDGHAMTVLLWSIAHLAVLHPPPPGCRQQCVSHLCALLPACQPRQLASCLHSMALLGWRPPQRWLLRLQAAVQRRLHAFNGQDLANLVWALAALGAAPEPRWLAWLLLESLPKLQQLRPQEVANLAWGVAQLGHAPAGTWTQQLAGSCRRLLLASAFAPAEVTQLAWALGKLGWQPDSAWAAAFWGATLPLLRSFSANELGATAHAVSKLGMQPPAPWVAALTASVQARCAQFDAAGVVQVLSALRLLTRPAPAPPTSSRGRTRLGARRARLWSAARAPVVFDALCADPQAAADDAADAGLLAWSLAPPRMQMAPAGWMGSSLCDAYSVASLLALAPERQQAGGGWQSPGLTAGQLGGRLLRPRWPPA